MKKADDSTMAKGMIILGPAGSGKTTLGRQAAKELGIAYLDIDDYIWRTDTTVPYTVMYSRQEKIDHLLAAVNEVGEFVMAGSMNSFHEHFDPMFRLAVYLTADEVLRMERVHQRELGEFGNRILPGGDMYEEHQKFLTDVGGYEHGAGSCNREQHELWISQLTCPVLRLDGGEELTKNLAMIVESYRRNTNE